MKTIVVSVILLLSFNISAQLKVDSLIIIEGDAQQLSIEEGFVIENIGDEEVKYFWHIQLNGDLPEEWEFYYKGVNACWGPFDSSYGKKIHLPCDDSLAVTVSFAAGLIYPHNLIQVYTNNQPGKVSLDFCLIEVCGDIETAFTCSKVIINAKDITKTTHSNEREDLVLCPNPIDQSSLLKIRTDYVVSSLRFFNSSGLNLLTVEHKKDQQHDISALTGGLYFVALNDDKGQIISVQKLLVH